MKVQSPSRVLLNPSEYPNDCITFSVCSTHCSSIRFHHDRSVNSRFAFILSYQSSNTYESGKCDDETIVIENEMSDTRYCVQTRSGHRTKTLDNDTWSRIVQLYSACT